MKSNGRQTSSGFPWWGYLPVYMAPFLLFLPALMPGKALFWGITSLQFVPWHWEALRSLLAGELPLWNIWNGMGAPLAANYQSALFYPPTWLTLLAGWAGGIQAMAWSHGLLIVLHLVWAGEGMKRLTARLGLSPIPQIICALAYSLCGYLVARGSFLTMIQAAAWIPWIILAASRFGAPVRGMGRSGITGKDILWLALAFSGQWLSGHAQLAWYTLLFTLAWTTTGALVNGGWRSLVRIILPVAASGFLALLVCSIQLVPTLEYFGQSQRSGVIDYQTALSYSFWPWRLLALVFPDLFGNPGTGDFWGYANYWEDAIYFGLLPLFFALYYIFSGKNRRNTENDNRNGPLFGFCLLSTGLIFLLALGWNTPVFPWLFRNIPTFGSFNGPTRWMILAVFCLVILAGLGAEEWMKHPIIRRTHINMMIVGIIAMLMAGAAAIFTMPTVKVSFKSALIAAGILALGYLIFALMKPSPENHTKTRNWRFIFVIWLMVDLFWAGWRLNPAVESSLYTTKQNQTSINRYYLPQTAERDLRFKRFFNFEDIQETADWENIFPAILPNTNILTSKPMVNNFDPMLPDRFVGFTNELETATSPALDRLLSLAGVGSAGTVGIEKPYSLSWEPIDANPHEWVTTCAETVTDEAGALAWLKKTAYTDRLSSSIVIEAKSTHQPVCGIPSRSKPEINATSNLSTRREFKVTGNAADGYLFIADTWYPGWIAFVDGMETPVFRADYVFMSVELPAGDHTVKIEYRPASFTAGVLLTLAGIVICAILGFRKRSSSGGSH